MTFRIFSYSLLCTGLFLGSCSKSSSSSSGQPATVLMRDGTQVAGTVVSASATEIQLLEDDKQTHTIPMSQVRSIEYQDPATAKTAAPPDATTDPHPDHYHPVGSAVTTRTFELPVGAQVSVRNEETIDSGKAVEGQTFPAEVTRDVKDAGGDVVIPRGSNAQIVIRSISGGRIRGASDLVIDLATISVDGQEYEVSTRDLEKRGNPGVGANRRTGLFAGGGAAFGAVIGAIAGGGKGAAIGAASGAGAGTATEIVTKGKVKIPVETILTFRLDQPLRISAAQ